MPSREVKGMEKVVLTKTQADFLDDKLNHAKILPQNIVFGFANPSSGIVGEIFIEHFDLETLIKALYIGYVVEKSPEEQIKVIWDCFDPVESFEEYDKGVRYGINSTLEAFNITVKGIND